MGITIIGLGPGHIDQLTLQAWRILEQADEVYLRTSRHPLTQDLPHTPTYHSFDNLYDTATNFESLYQTITDRIIELGQRPQGVIYAVPGHPMVGENTPLLILKAAKQLNIPITIIDGLSFIEPSLRTLEIDGIEGLQLHDAIEIAQVYHPSLNPDQPALIAQVYNQSVASDLKLTLMNQYPDDYPVTLLHGAGTSEGILEKITLYELDRSTHIAHMTTLYIPPMKIPSSFAALQNIMAHLRSSEGCPWDRKQTHRSLRPYLLEETYEILEAIDADNPQELAEELGDVLLHIVFQSQIATDDGEFYITEVVSKVIDKMVRRHPHIWGDIDVEDADHVVRNWEAIKKQEDTTKPKRDSQLDGVPKGLPALTQAFRLQERAAGVGFDWAKIDPVIAKVHEEINEIKSETDPVEQAKEFGDLLFAVVNWIRWSDLDPESVLRETNTRFRRRFAYIENKANQNKSSISDLTLEEMDTFWEAAKSEGL